MGNKIYNLAASEKVLSTPEMRANKDVLEKLLKQAEELKLSEKDRVHVTIDKGVLWFGSMGQDKYIGTRTIAKLKRLYEEIVSPYESRFA